MTDTRGVMKNCWKPHGLEWKGSSEKWSQVGEEGLALDSS